MGLYDDEDAAVVEGPVDDENYYFIKVWEKWLTVAMKQRMKEDGVKRILEQIIAMSDKALAKFPQHKELQASKEKATKIIGKIQDHASSVDHPKSTPGWHQELCRKGWANAHYAAYLNGQGRTKEAKSRAEDAVYRIGQWLKDKDASAHVTFPKAELEEALEKAKAI